LRLNSQLSVSGGIRSLVDPRERLVEPRPNTAEHDVVVRIHAGAGLFLPEFPQRHGAARNHVAPARISRLYGEVVGRSGTKRRYSLARPPAPPHPVLRSEVSRAVEDISRRSKALTAPR